MIKKSLTVVGSIVIILVLIVIFNVFVGNPTISRVTDGTWGGYYDTDLYGRVWCVVRFFNVEKGLKMVILTAGPILSFYDVSRSSSDKRFVHYEMKTEGMEIYIKAKQLYLGQRYVVERLLAGRIKDFWKANDDDAIRGYFIEDGAKFAIERIDANEAVEFLNKASDKKVFRSVSEMDEFLEREIERRYE